MSIIDRARALRAIIEQNAQTMTAEKAVDYPELFPEWSGDGREYKAGEMVRHNGVLMKVLQAHTSQEGWAPDAAPSLFAKVLIEPTVEPDTVPAWEQPGSTNPYMKGDKVTHNDVEWVSTIDNNVWEPGIYGWTALI